MTEQINRRGDVIKFGVLGAIQVERGGQAVEISAMLQRILALLLSQDGAPISIDALADGVWEGQPPPSARKTLQVYVHRLRRILGDDRRVTHSAAGYALEIQPGELDANAFELLVSQGRDAAVRGELEVSFRLYTEALALWRGEPYTDLQDFAPLDAERIRLAEHRLTAIEARAAVGLEMGSSEQVVEELTRASADYPFREGLRSQLMLALYRSGRQVDALEVYRHTRRLLADELGLEPPAQMQRLHEQMLRNDPSLDLVPKPRFLPRDVSDFVGRQADLEWLDAMADDGAPVVVSAIAGTAGIGKTALAVRWAHRVARRYPDGQLYVNLRGYDSGPPLRPIDALGHLLRCLDVPPSQVPATVDDAIARYRTLLNDRRVLVVLDNARTVDQVRPLLPGEAGCHVVVTSRDRLSGLISRDGARRLTLGILAAEDSLALLQKIVGPTRMGADPQGAAGLVRLCGGLPLVLRIAAAQLADQPDRAISQYVAELMDRSRIEALAVEGDEDFALGPILDRSFECLPGSARRVLCLLGVIPGFEFTAEAVAALAGTTLADATSALDTLTAGHLVEEPRSGRYALHDLIGEYARERLATEPESGVEGLRRVLDFLLGGARKSISLMVSGRPYEGDDDPAPAIFSAATAMAWLDAERVNLANAMQAAISEGLLDFAAGIAAPLWRYFNYTERLSEWVATFENAVSAMEDADPVARYQFLNLLGAGYSAAGRLEDAIRVHERCLAGRLAIADDLGAAQSRINLAMCLERQGRYAEAMPHMEFALEISRRLDDRSLEMLLLGGNLPVVLNKMGRHEEARDCVLEAMKLVEESGTAFELLRAQHHLGDTYVLLGEPALAQPVLEKAMHLARELGDLRMVAMTLVIMGVAHRKLGDYATAIEMIAQGCETLQQPSLICENLNILGATHLIAGNRDEARAAHDRALEVATEIGATHEQARAHVGLAKVASQGDPVAALAHLAEALPTLDRLSANEANEARGLVDAINGTDAGSRRNTA